MIPSINEVSTKRVVTIDENAPFGEASAIMYAHKIRHLPVVNRLGKLIGVVTQKDRPFSESDWGQKVCELMSSPVEVAHEKSSLTVVMETMLSKKVSSVVVVDDQSEIIGIVTTDDVLRYFLQNLRVEESKLDSSAFSRMQLVGQVMHSLAQAGI